MVTVCQSICKRFFFQSCIMFHVLSPSLIGELDYGGSADY